MCAYLLTRNSRLYTGKITFAKKPKLLWEEGGAVVNTRLATTNASLTFLRLAVYFFCCAFRSLFNGPQ